MIADSEQKDSAVLSFRGIDDGRQIRESQEIYSIECHLQDAGYSPHKLRVPPHVPDRTRNSIFDVQALLDHENVTTTQLYAAHKKNVKQDLVRNFEWEDEFDNKSK
jgi:site-specific recombinase XerC